MAVHRGHSIGLAVPEKTTMRPYVSHGHDGFLFDNDNYRNWLQLGTGLRVFVNRRFPPHDAEGRRLDPAA